MSNLIDGVAKLEGRRQAIIDRQKETANPNHALLERIELEHDILNAVPKLLDAMGLVRAGDAEKLDLLIYQIRTSTDLPTDMRISFNWMVEILLRYRGMAAKMEEESE